MPRVWRIVCTGGPCAGKTTSILRLKSFLENRGFFVISIPESATFLRTSGIRWTPADPNAFQKAITSTQANHEDIFYEFASKIAESKNCQAVILCDRGLIDGSVYVTDKMFNECLSYCNLPEKSKIYDRYDCVLHLVTAASGAEKFYTTGDLRRETIEEAIENDRKLIKAWESHPKHYVFDNYNKSFEAKLRELVTAICNLLKIPNTSKIPKKFLLHALPNIPVDLDSPCVISRVRKIYLVDQTENDSNNYKHEYSFIRLRTSNNASFYVLKNVTNEDGQRIERKHILSKRQFEEYMQFSDTARHIVEQKRTSLTIGSCHYEICEYIKPMKGLVLLNVYPENVNYSNAIAPSWCDVDKDVTHEFEYSAHYLSLKNPESISASRMNNYMETESPLIASIPFQNGAVKHIHSGVIGGCF